jgi:PPK2 family polyphosphate:nucleotide phosphotransferase
MFEAVGNPFMVPFDGSFSLKNLTTSPPEDQADKERNRKERKGLVREFRELQRVLYAHDQYAVLLIFQALDAAGKDGTIRRVMTGVNPAGFQVFSFKQPSAEELDHDFLWRTSKRLPERGRIGVFNRSYYEEVLVVRVHPEFLGAQKLPAEFDLQSLWEERYASIREHEKHLAQNGTMILKFWLNVSKDEQKERFLSRLNEPEKHWKFAPKDVKERSFWDDYMQAFEDALIATSRPWAPWYAIPADDKPFMRRIVTEIIVDNLQQLDLNYPQVGEEKLTNFEKMRTLLEED